MNTELMSSNLKHIVFALFAAMLFWSIALAQTDSTLSGDNMSPTVATSAKGYATINVGPDKSITGTVNTSGIVGIGVHIHSGASGDSGPVVVTLTRTGEDLWSIPAGMVLNDAQFASYNAGELYVDVHSARYIGGEIRGQLRP